MPNGDEQRQNDRRVILVNRIRQDFPNANITVLTEEYALEHGISGDLTWRVKIEISTPHRATVILQPGDPFIMDMNNQFERIFEDGISLARRLLSNTLDQAIKIHLTNEGISTEEAI